MRLTHEGSNSTHCVSASLHPGTPSGILGESKDGNPKIENGIFVSVSVYFLEHLSREPKLAEDVPCCCGQEAEGKRIVPLQPGGVKAVPITDSGGKKATADLVPAALGLKASSQ
jgi:hypothetical protein